MKQTLKNAFEHVFLMTATQSATANEKFIRTKGLCIKTFSCLKPSQNMKKPLKNDAFVRASPYHPLRMKNLFFKLKAISLRMKN